MSTFLQKFFLCDGVQSLRMPTIGVYQVDDFSIVAGPIPLIPVRMPRAGLPATWTAPAFPEAGYSVSRDFIELVALFIERFLGLGWRDVSDWLQQASIVEPVDPFQGFPFHGICCFPRAQPVDDLRFE